MCVWEYYSDSIKAAVVSEQGKAGLFNDHLMKLTCLTIPAAELDYHFRLSVIMKII